MNRIASQDYINTFLDASVDVGKGDAYCPPKKTILDWWKPNALWFSFNPDYEVPNQELTVNDEVGEYSFNVKSYRMEGEDLIDLSFTAETDNEAVVVTSIVKNEDGDYTVTFTITAFTDINTNRYVIITMTLAETEKKVYFLVRQLGLTKYVPVTIYAPDGTSAITDEVPGVTITYKYYDCFKEEEFELAYTATMKQWKTVHEERLSFQFVPDLTEDDDVVEFTITLNHDPKELTIQLPTGYSFSYNSQNITFLFHFFPHSSSYYDKDQHSYEYRNEWDYDGTNEDSTKLLAKTTCKFGELQNFYFTRILDPITVITL